VARPLILLRHGQSTANAADVFCGWLDVPLSERGRCEAARAGELLAEHGLLPDTVHTSMLRRAICTADIAAKALGRPWLPVNRSWWLNERHYGSLQGRARASVCAEAGEADFLRWRRSYHHAPPPRTRSVPGGPGHHSLSMPSDVEPLTESLADVRHRVVRYWEEHVAVDLRSGGLPLVVAHGNSLRALQMHLDRLSPDEVTALEVPTGVPLRYDLDPDLQPVVRGGTYLTE
jgi:2,3-bisphosphoglycerate-dependent phosphoglycerate mutase